MPRRNPSGQITKGLSTQWQIILAFFLGGAVSSLAQDPSDTLFFWASSKGPLSADQATLYWYWVPFLVYISLFLFGFILAKATNMPPTFLIWFFTALIVGSAVVSLLLPQNASLIYIGSVVLGTIISIGIALGLRRHTK
jgi:hypothetical protein